MEVETVLRGKYDGKKMRKEFKTLHDDTDLCKMHQWLITSVSLYSASTNWKLSLWWFAFVYDWKDLASCFPLQWTSSSQRSGSKSPSHSGLVPLFIHRHWHMQQVLHWLELLMFPHKKQSADSPWTPPRGWVWLLHCALPHQQGLSAMKRVTRKNGVGKTVFHENKNLLWR